MKNSYTPFILIACLSYTFISNNLLAQVVIDWSKQHTSTNIDLIGWNNEFLSATITDNNQFKINSGGYQDVIINYVNWDGSQWTARLNGDNFLHAPNGNWNAAHPDARMDYIAPDRSNWSATISGNGFILKDQNGQSHQSDFLSYITWDGTTFTAELDKPKFIHTAGIIHDHHIKISSTINYLTWNRSKWTARINADGTFIHTSENGVSHSDKNIIYLNYDGSMWGAKLDNKVFVHAIAFIPKEKTFGNKVLEVVHGMGLGNGFPDIPPPIPSPTEEIRGIFVEEENGTMWFRPLDTQGLCTDDLSSISSSSIISRTKISSCYNLGSVRDVYSFICKKKSSEFGAK